MLSILFLFLGGAVVLAAPASAATCYGDYCSNKDPQATGCSTNAWTQNASVDVYSAGVVTNEYAGRLELRASNTCGTQWGRFTSQGDFSYQVRLEQPATGYVTDWQNAGPWVSSWTNQIYSPNYCVRAHIITSGWIGFKEEYYTGCI